MKIISSITEAFSMQPYSVYIKGEGHLIKNYGKEVDELRINTKQVNSNEEISVIQGIINNSVVCEYIVSSVNIHYK